MHPPIGYWPTNKETDPNVIYQGLGTFWTSIFQEKSTLQGYTYALAEEQIQRYVDLLEAISSYSTKDIQVLHKERWFPIFVFKSRLNKSPLVFNANDAVFGPQPESDLFYGGVTFKFGYPKLPAPEVYSYHLGGRFKEAATIVNRVIHPTVTLISGVDFTVENGTIFFNSDIFNNPAFSKTSIIGDNGVPITYTTNEGVVEEEELVVLWAFNAKIDNNQLYYAFGHIFDVQKDNTEFHKVVIDKLFSLCVDGPTVNNIISVCNALMGIPVALSDEEVEDVFVADDKQIVVTDKNVYRFPTSVNLLADVAVGKSMKLGETFTDSVVYYDSNSYGDSWWNNAMQLKSKIALSPYLFLGNYTNQLIFSNNIELITVDANQNIVFPVEGETRDVAEFNRKINSPATKAIIQELFGVHNVGDSNVINPVDFLFSNFFKKNTVLLKFKFDTDLAQAAFMRNLPILKEYLPPYVYVLFDLDLEISEEVYSKLNNSTPIEFTDGTRILNADGSNNNGTIELLAPYGYTDINRLFSISLGIEGIADQYISTEVVEHMSTEQAAYTAAKHNNAVLTVTEGKPLEEPTTGLGTRQFPKLSLLSFTT